MKELRFLLLLLFICFFSKEITAQDSNSYKTEAFTTFINKLEKKFDVRFSYESELIDSIKTPSNYIDFKLDSLIETLEIDNLLRFEKLSPRFFLIKLDVNDKQKKKLSGSGNK